jgi:hypothetical protein
MLLLINDVSFFPQQKKRERIKQVLLVITLDVMSVWNSDHLPDFNGWTLKIARNHAYAFLF